jgi:hypothetical protein
MREGRLIERREEMRKSKFPLKHMTGKRLLDGQKRRSKDSVKLISKEKVVLDSFVSGYEPVAGFCEHGNEPFGSVKGGLLLD